MKIQIFIVSLPHASSRHWSNPYEKDIFSRLPKKYKELEFDHASYGLLLYGAYCELVPIRGRPRKLWHPDPDISLKNFYNYNMQRLNWIEKKSFEVMWDQREVFRFWDYG